MAERTVNTAELNKQDKVLFNAAERMRETVTVPGAPVGPLAGAELPRKPSGGIDWTIAVDRNQFDGSGRDFDPGEIGNRAREATNVDNVQLPDVSGDFGKIKLVLIALLVVVSAGQLGKLFSIGVGT